jgi:hypothetical protein
MVAQIPASALEVEVEGKRRVKTSVGASALVILHVVKIAHGTPIEDFNPVERLLGFRSSAYV